jgi:hypothetical protein
MGKFELGITDASRKFCRTWLKAEQLVPQDTLFRGHLFDETRESVRARNEAMVVEDISTNMSVYQSSKDLWRHTSQVRCKCIDVKYGAV